MRQSTPAPAENRRGNPVDDAKRPAWTNDYLTQRQRDGLLDGLLWMLLLYEQRDIDASRISVAQRIYIGCSGGRDGWVWEKSLRSLAKELSLSQTTVTAALADLEQLGWLVVQTGTGMQSNLYGLAWPAVDPLAQEPRKEQCGQPTKKNLWCTTTAGKGTIHPGKGPCWRHGGTRATGQTTPAQEPPAPEPGPETDAPVPQRLEHEPAAEHRPQVRPDQVQAAVEEPVVLQPLEQEPVENEISTGRPRLTVLQPLGHRPVENARYPQHWQPPLLQPLETAAPTIEVPMLQPLGNGAPTVGAMFVQSVGVCNLSNDTSPRSTSAGSRPDRRSDGTFQSEAAG